MPLSHFFPLFPFFSSVFSLLSSFPLRYLRSYFFRSFFSLQSSICTTHSCSLHPTFLTRIYEMANSSSVVFRFVDGDGETTTTTKTRKTTTFEEDLFLTYSTHVRFHCSSRFFLSQVFKLYLFTLQSFVDHFKQRHKMMSSIIQLLLNRRKS